MLFANPFFNFVSLLSAQPQTATVLLWALFIISIVMLFMNSGAEIAFFSIGYKDIKNLRSKKYPGANKILYLIQEPNHLMSSMLVGNTVFRLLIILLCNYLIRDDFFPGLTGVLLFLIRLLIAVFIILLFGELLPKVWSANNHIRFAFYSSSFVYLNFWIFRRPGKWFALMTESIERSLGFDGNANNRLDKIEDAIAAGSSMEVSEDEKNILRGVAQFGNITVRRAMRGRLDVHGIAEASNFSEVKQKVSEQQYSRFPVYKDNLDSIIGMLHSKDLIPYLEQGEDFNWKQLLRPPLFIHEQMLVADLLKKFQSTSIHFAVVVDEFGGTDGIITMEDILEEIVGEIRDEYDEEEMGNIRIDDFNFIFDGKMMISEACKIMKMPNWIFDFIKGESETIAGLVLELAGKLPEVGQELVAKDFTFSVLERAENRINRVKVSIASSPKKMA